MPSAVPRTLGLYLGAICVVTIAACDRARSESGARAEARAEQDASGNGTVVKRQEYRGLLGKESWKIRREDGKTYLWAGGDQSGPGAHWYEFTDAPIPAAELQFGIGKDRIKSIDDPMYVSPDDPRLLTLAGSPYRTGEKPKTVDEIQVIGYVRNGEARAYPVALLDRHELVNDRIGGKPVTVGW